MGIVTVICKTCKGPAYLDDRTPERKRQWIDCWFCSVKRLLRDKDTEGRR